MSDDRIQKAIDELNFYRNLFYKESSTTERGIIANAINDILPEFIKLYNTKEDVTGVWYYVDNEKQLECSRCKCRISNYTVIHKADGYSTNNLKFCPECGSKNR